MKKKREPHPCRRLGSDHVEWVIRKHASWKWWRTLRQDVTKDLLRDFLKTSAFFILRWVLPIVAGGAAIKAFEKVFP